jgi:hypothetical protein
VLGGDRRGADGVQVLGHLVAWPYVRGGESCSKMERERGSRVGHARKASAGLHLSKNIQPKGVLYQYVHRCSECRERERLSHQVHMQMHGRPFF